MLFSSISRFKFSKICLRIIDNQRNCGVRSVYVSFSRSVHAKVAQKDEVKPVDRVKFQERAVKIETCGNIYGEWRKQRTFFRVPDGDLTFNVRYVDTLYTENEKSSITEDSAVAVALHGVPGSYQDFSILTSYLFHRGVRVIAPCFPDFSIYKPGIFRHSVREKMQYIKDFLKAINVPGVDMLICHSSAVYTGLRLCFENQSPRINSLCLFNPGAYRTSMTSTSPFGPMRYMVKMTENEVGLKLFQSFGPKLLKLIGSPVRYESVLDPLLSATTMAYAEIPQARQYLHDLSKLHFPVFLAFSEDDKMIQKDLSYKIAYVLGVFDRDICYVNEKGDITNKGQIFNNVKVMAFEKGSHYVFSKWPEIINENVYAFMEKYVL